MAALTARDIALLGIKKNESEEVVKDEASEATQKAQEAKTDESSTDTSSTTKTTSKRSTTRKRTTNKKQD